MFRMHKLKYQSKSGAVSMITVMLMSIVLLVLVIGLVQIMTNEQRQSSDNELTNRAFYTAEAGLESARQYIAQLSAPEVKSLAATKLAEADCLSSSETGSLNGGVDAVLIDDDNYRAEVICQKIAGVDGGTYIVGPEMGVNSPRQYNLGTNKERLRVQWAEKSDNSSVVFRDNSNRDKLPSSHDWDSVAMLRLQFFSFGSGLNRDDLLSKTREIFVVPANGTGTHNISNTNQLAYGDCTNLVNIGQKMCSIDITGLSNSTSVTDYVKISYLYETATTNLTPLYAGGGVDNQLVSQLRVDTTGKVGDIYRRVQANVDVDSTLSDYLPGYTLLGNQICKSFRVTESSSEFSSINNNNDSDYCDET